jgi:hypothetical protein
MSRTSSIAPVDSRCFTLGVLEMFDCGVEGRGSGKEVVTRELI